MRGAPWPLLLVGVLLAPSLRAEDAGQDDRRARARELAQQGDAAFSVGRCDKAIPLWQRAESEFHAPTLLLRTARCQALLGKVVDATAMLEAITAERLPADAPEPFLTAQAEAKHDLPSVRARIATLAIEVEGGDPSLKPTIEIDDKLVSSQRKEHLVDPGQRRLRVRVRDATWEQTVPLDDGEHKTLRVAFAVEPQSHAIPAQRLVGYGLGALGIVSLAVGAGFGYAATQTSHSLSDACGPDRSHCPPDRQGDIDRLRTQALVSDLTLGSGAALFAAGTLLVLTSPARHETPRIRFSPLGLGAVARGEF